MKLKALFVLAGLTVSTLAFAETPTYLLLKDRRSTLSLPQLSLKEKTEVLNAARFVYKDLFVHEEWKMNRYGTKTNLSPLFEEFENKFPSLSEEDFHTGLAKIFNRLQDLHTAYYFPKPYSCFRNLLPVSFQEIKDSEGKSKYIVSDNIVDKEARSALSSPLNIKVGDEVLEYNGKTIEAAIKEKMINPGANPDALKRNAVFDLVFSSQKISVAPKEDSVDVVLKKATGEIYRTSIPWISKAKSTCLKPSTENGKHEQGPSLDLMDHKRIFRTTLKTIRYNSPAPSVSLGVNPFQPTEEPIVTWKTIKNIHGTFGVIKLESFEPEKLTVLNTVALIKELLLTKLAKTDGLIFDLRDNPGGRIRLGEYLVQLVTPKSIAALNFTAKANASNLHYFETNYSSKWVQGIKEAIEGNKSYTAPITISPQDMMGAHGQVYYRPVALFTNSLCYSTCDMIAAQMQDHAAALIVGEDSTTGAGGANSHDLETLYAEIDNKGPFPKLPQGTNIGFSWRQTLRVGKNVGKILEDVGVLSDQIIPPTYNDIVNDSQDQYTKISKLLKTESMERPRSSVTLTKDTIDFVQHDTPELFLQWENTDRIAFYHGNALIDVIDLEPSNSEGRKVDLSSIVDARELSSMKVELRGLRNNTIVWKRLVTLRTIPPTISLDSPRSIDLSKELALYGKNGWRVHGEQLKIGDGVQYEKNVKTEASLLTRLPRAMTMMIKAKIKTEPAYDYFHLHIVSEGKEIPIWVNQSGEINTRVTNIDLGEYVGKDIEIRMKFESDEVGVDEGVTIESIWFENN